MLPKRLTDVLIIGIYNPGNHWTTFAIIKEQDTQKFTLYVKDSFGEDINLNLKEAIETKYGEAQQIIYHAGKEQLDVTSCGIYALNNACIIATWLKMEIKPEFQSLNFTVQDDI